MGFQHEEDKLPLTLIKIGSIIIVLGVSLLFGLFPLFCNACKSSVKFLGIANAFSGGIFLGIGLFHLLPEAAEGLGPPHEHEEEPKLKHAEETLFQQLPMAYFIAFLSYSLILFIEKVAFDSHALVQHSHGDEDDHGHGHDHGKKDDHSHGHGKSKVSDQKKPLIEHAHDHDHDGHAHDDSKDSKQVSINLVKRTEGAAALANDKSEESEDEQEETIKNVLSAKGKFASFMLARNTQTLRKSLRASLIEGGNTSADKIMSSNSFVHNRALRRASAILGNPSYNPDDEDKKFMVSGKIEDPDKVTKTMIEKEMEAVEEAQLGSNMTPYLLLLALSMHGFFEGVALGVQSTVGSTLKLGFAILSHKWAEAFTLGISFQKSFTEKATFIKLICLFSIFTPLGILLGFFISSNRTVESVFLAISTGTFLYVACSEVIVEEFAITKYKWMKFLFFILGGGFISLLTIIDVLNGGHSHGDEHSHE